MKSRFIFAYHFAFWKTDTYKINRRDTCVKFYFEHFSFEIERENILFVLCQVILSKCKHDRDNSENPAKVSKRSDG